MQGRCRIMYSKWDWSNLFIWKDKSTLVHPLYKTDIFPPHLLEQWSWNHFQMAATCLRQKTKHVPGWTCSQGWVGTGLCSNVARSAPTYVGQIAQMMHILWNQEIFPPESRSPPQIQPSPGWVKHSWLEGPSPDQGTPCHWLRGVSRQSSGWG